MGVHKDWMDKMVFFVHLNAVHEQFMKTYEVMRPRSYEVTIPTTFTNFLASLSFFFALFFIVRSASILQSLYKFPLFFLGLKKRRELISMGGGGEGRTLAGGKKRHGV